MNRWIRITIAAAAMAAAASLGAQPVAPAAADAIRNAPGRDGTYAWVDAASATDNSGHLRLDKFGEATEGMEHLWAKGQTASDCADTAAIASSSGVPTVRVLTGAAEACVCRAIWMPPLEEGDPASRTLRSRVRGATGIYVAVARKITPGFSYDDPASLIEADPIEIVREVPGRNRNAKRLFLTYSFARFRVGNVTACVGPTPIHEGDRFLVFTVGSPLDRTGYLMRALHYVYIDGGGEVHSPDHAADIGIVSPGHSAAAPTFDEFVDLVKSLAKGEVQHVP